MFLYFTDMSLYFMSELDIQEKIGKVKDELKSWRNGLIVMHKFIKELEKVQTVGTWHSLLKFVHHFLELKNATGNGTSQSGIYSIYVPNPSLSV